MQLRKTGLSWQIVADDLVVLDIEQSVYLKLNSAGRTLWERLAEPCSEDDLQSALVDEFGVDEAQARADTAHFIRQMRERHLLEE